MRPAQLMRPTSRRALAQARERVDGLLDKAKPADAEKLAEELFSAVDVLQANPVLRRHLGDPSTSPDDRTKLTRAVFGKKLGKQPLQVLEDLARARWSQPRDLLDAAETLGRLAMLTVAQKADKLEDVEDELFRTGRLIDREPALQSRLGDQVAPLQGRVGLLRAVLSGKVHPVTERLLVRALQAPLGRPLDRAAEDLAELAADRRERSVAWVSTPVALSDEQHERLADGLSRLYGRPISLLVELAPELLGGLVVRVGDEVIDGSVAGRIELARQRVPR